MTETKTIHTVTLSSKGRGVSADKKFEVIGALPAEKCLIELGPRKRKARIGFLREVLTASPLRTSPRCIHVPDCGGCSIQQMEYAAQLVLKEQSVVKAFSPYIQENTEIRPIIGCSDPWRYRNKMEFSFSQNNAGEKFLGLMLAGSRGKVLNLSQCHLVSPWFLDALNTVKEWWEKSHLHAYKHHRDAGHLRTLTLREAKQGKGKLAMLTVSGNPEYALKKEQIKAFVHCLKEVSQDPNLSIFLQVHQIGKGRPTQFFEMLLGGPDHITETLHIELENQSHSLDFKISPTSFFQPNTLQAQKLYSLGLGMLTDLKNALVFDLYCGSGTLGLSAALTAKEVIGIELNPHAVFDAQWNQETNGLKNFSVFRGDVGEVLSKKKGEFKFSLPDVVIVDPPRMGLDDKALNQIKELQAKEILYISCNPETQAANIEELTKVGYRLVILQPVDQFPHTMHIENICLLKRRSST